jgi:TatA/E family protein of Tat protein translocase
VFGIGAQELVLILVVALLVFGPKRLPELARTLGRGVAEFRRSSSELRRSLNEAADLARVEPPAENRRAPGAPEPAPTETPRPDPDGG